MSFKTRILGAGGMTLGTEANPAISALELVDNGITDDGDYFINVGGTPTLLNCKLSNTFQGGFYGPNTSKAGWTQFAMRVAGPDYDTTEGRQKLDITTNTNTPDPNTTSTSWSLGTFKNGFDTSPSYSTETEVMIDIDDTHSVIVNGFKNVATTEANTQISIVRGYTSPYNVLSGGASSWNNTTLLSNTSSGCTTCYRPVYKYKDASYGEMRLTTMTAYHSGYLCSDWCSSGHGNRYTEYFTPILNRSEGCYSGSTGCGTIGITLGYTGTITRFYFRERPV